MAKSSATTSTACIDRRLRLAAVVLAAALVLLLLPHCGGQPPAAPPALLLDTDISSDADDVGAVAVLHALASQGRVRILGMMVSSADPWSAPCLEAVNTWFGRPEIPVGVLKGGGVRHESSYTRAVANEFPRRPAAAPAEATALYRQLLAAQADQSVTIVTVGYLTNLRNLLLSAPDAASPLDGGALIRKKVRRLVCMGGQYPAGKEWNLHQDAAAAAHVIRHWPAPAVFVGFEAGKDVLTGAGLRNLPAPHPIRRSYELHNGLAGRPSWDQIAVYYAALTADGGQSGLWSEVPGSNLVAEDGSNQWLNRRAAADQAYLVQRGATAEIAARIERLMLGAGE